RHFVQSGNKPVEALLGKPLTREYSLHDLAKRPEVQVGVLLNAAGVESAGQEVNEQVEIDIKYQGYIVRQQDEIDRVFAQQEMDLPKDLDYLQIHGLSNEVKQKLGDAKPATLGQAGRISGVTPAAIALLLVHLKKLHLSNSRKSLRQQA
ncbi:MAG: tRNA uridine 5-carboxymethylaminomethyl modification enzyme, partial [Candidatus Azotimanducaceae bacterium]